MAKSKWTLHTIYISERLRDNLRPLSRYALTAVVAPMGYGKTTAVNWYLEHDAKAKGARIIRISIYADNLAMFWQSVQRGFAHAGFDFLGDYDLPTDATGWGLLADDMCRELKGQTPCYLFIDDFHLLANDRAAIFLCTLAGRLPEHVHIIVASRNRFLPASEIVRLGNKVYQIGTEQLRLNRAELATYARRCGTNLSDEELTSLLYASEGWFSAVYLNLKTFLESGALPDCHSDIYAIFTAAMIEPLPPKEQEFLAVMGLTDEFTVEMARAVTGDTDAEKRLTSLTERNAFVKRLPDGVTYRFHHMMKECAARTFLALPKEKKLSYQQRLGTWYESQGWYLHAIESYLQSKNYYALLRVIQQDAGTLLASFDSKKIIAAMEDCPVSVLKAHPFALLVLMRRMFTWRHIPKMRELKELLMEAMEEHTELSAEERGNLLGECDLIMSFLCYNDISAMSRLHRSASAQMSRPAISIDKNGGWTFGSPSVLMMFYRGAGELQRELAEMDDCMPHYYNVTDGHGCGAEKIMRAEAYFMKGRFADAHIELERAYARIEGNGQECMALCCDFLARRLSLCMDVAQRYTFEERRAALVQRHNAAWLNMWSATSAYYHALLGKTERIPAVFAAHRLGTIHFLAPGKPMMEMIENQVYLAQGAYAKVIGRSERQLAVCDAMKYALVALHIRIQTVAAYERLGKHEQARALLTQALSEAETDGLAMPFVENFCYIKPLISERVQHRFVQTISELGHVVAQYRGRTVCPAVFSMLTKREYEIVQLLSERLSNREIAEKLFLSEGSVKQYIHHLYTKLQLEGDSRSKRKRLSELFTQKN